MTPDLDALEKIAERLEKGESGPEIDVATAAALGLDVALQHRMPPNWSTSLDACEALRKRLLPHLLLTVDERSDRCDAALCEGPDYWWGFATTEPAARLCATLRAFIAQERAKQEGETDDR